MRKYLIATHGTFAGGIKSSLDIILGESETINLIEAYTETNKSLQEDIEEVMTQLIPEDELIVFTDLLGGSITNQILQFGLRENIFIVAGINLPLLLDIMLADSETPINEVIENGIENGREQMVFVNKLINSTKENYD